MHVDRLGLGVFMVVVVGVECRDDAVVLPKERGAGISVLLRIT